jgi:hypothetical protein
MATESNGSTRPSGSLIVPSRIFSEEFLAYLAGFDEPATAGEAGASGPRHLEPDPEGGWVVLREEESLESGDVPEATFVQKEVALLAAAVLPGTGRPDLYTLGEHLCEWGFPVFRDGVVVGYSRHFHEGFISALNVLDALLAAPLDFAWLLEAVGGTALERVDKIVARRLARRAEAG